MRYVYGSLNGNSESPQRQQAVHLGLEFIRVLLILATLWIFCQPPFFFFFTNVIHYMTKSMRTNEDLLGEHLITKL